MDIKEIFIKDNALLDGHFVLSSGLHSQFYMQSALVLKNVKNAELFGKMIADKILDLNISYDLVISPAMGGIIIGHEVARSLSVDFIFTERVDSEMILRRGFFLKDNQNVIVVEDVFTTGKSTKEVINLVNYYGSKVVCCASIVNRGNISFDVPTVSLLNLDIKNYLENECPLCKKGIKIEKPGSRFLK